MVRDLKNKLGFSDGVLNGFTLPCVVVGADHKIVFVNEQMINIVGRDGEADDYIGMSVGEFALRSETFETPSDLALSARKRVKEELCYLDAEDKEKIIAVTATPFYDMDDNILGSLTVWYDLTEIRKQQQIIEDRNKAITTVAQEANYISDHLSSAAEHLSSVVEETKKGSRTQLDRAVSTSSSMEEMNASILQIANHASQAARGAEEARATAQQGAQVVSQVVAAIKGLEAESANLTKSNHTLAEQVEAIGSIMQVINDIADQTNLLALNAAIEAARAGEAGRGFAVVADEVRKLAEKTMGATKEVGQAISSIREGARANSEATERAVNSVLDSTKLVEMSQETLERIVSMAGQTAEGIMLIAAATEEHSAASQQIHSAAEEIKLISSETSDNMSQSHEALNELAGLASQLNNLMRDMQAHEQ